ncbi:class I SAM-dependent methyltransferase [Halobacterium noricense]|uniref:FkbM family methyltransferase n=1 Tax=Halobacterium noricense TaxID=223182 RepID=UPI001E4444A2|nr:FkbM family methyltransferase [Halobacterium noricense]UHH26571.1 FkbM family methyltransferase [Halobacterium noricense]
MASLGAAKRIYRDEGILQLARKTIYFGYNNYLRILLPKRTVMYNQVSVAAGRVADSLIPWQTTDIPDYEGGLIRGIREYVDDGDTVVVVGGGWGVSTVAAARQAGSSGRVVTFEGAKEAVERVEETVEKNHVRSRVSVQHATVAQAHSLRGNADGAKVMDPSNLPACDVLVLDCEGAELDIIDEMEIQPKVLIVETHGMYDAPELAVRDRLDQAGYEVVESMVAEKRLQSVCEKNGIYVLYSVRHGSTY